MFILSHSGLSHLCRKASETEKNTQDESEIRRIYEEPDEQGAATMATARPGNFELTKCPAYMSTATNEAQPTQSGEYEYIMNDSSVTPC